MTPQESVHLVAKVRAVCPGMEIVEGMPQMWYAVLADLRILDCELAVLNLARRSSAYIAPADIRQEVSRIRTERINGTPDPIPPPGAADDSQRYLAWIRETRQAIADGTYAPSPRPGLKTRDMRAIVSAFQRTEQ